MLIKRITLPLLALCSIILPHETYAALITDSDLSFGTIAITSNTSVSSVQLSRTGQATATGTLIILKLGQPGVYTLTELPPWVLVSLSANVPAFSFSTIPGTQQFTISAVDIPDTQTADESGTIQFKVGGVLQTSGVGGTYLGPATYQILLDIDISF